MELMNLFAENKHHFDFEEHSVSPPKIVAAIKTQITQLAGGAVLDHLDRMFKNTFRDCFPTDVLHASDLPKDIYHNIELRQGAPISTA